MYNNKKEFGDYQTPIGFCSLVCDYLKEKYLITSPEAIIEPTCGIGNFIQACLNKFSCHSIYGIDINSKHIEEAKNNIPEALFINKDIFNLNIKKIVKKNNVLIIGNPPWATNSKLESNLPNKTNFKGLRGIDALTGSSNFDICEYIILNLINQYKNTNSLICMLCKTSTARNVIIEISKNSIGYDKIEFLNFDSKKIFGVSVAACILIIKLSDKCVNSAVECTVKNFESQSIEDKLVVKENTLYSIFSTLSSLNLEGKCQLIWRQGIKHDCGKILELDIVDNKFINKYKAEVIVENDLIFPLVKSSHLKKTIITEFTKSIIVTQKKTRQDTYYIKETLPLTWNYLYRYITQFNKRKSIIYANTPLFSIFGVGDYSFAPYKVGISGFYKKPLFALFYSSKPVMADDTVYFLSFDNYDIAYSMMLLLNSKTVQTFLLSIAFLDNKRPYTVKLLSRLDLQKCFNIIPFEEIVTTEKELGLFPYITIEKYNNIGRVIT